MYRKFGFAHVALLFASASVYEYIYYDFSQDDSAEYALLLTALIAVGSWFKLEMIALEWLFRYFGMLGRIVNLANYKTLKYAHYLQIGAAFLLLDYASQASELEEEA